MRDSIIRRGYGVIQAKLGNYHMNIIKEPIF